MIALEYTSLHRLLGLVVWFSLRVPEVPGSIPGAALYPTHDIPPPKHHTMLSSMLCGRRTSISNFYLLLTKWSHCPSSKLVLQVIPHPSLSQFPPPPAGMTFLLAYSARDALILLFELAIPPQNRNFNKKAKKGLRDRNSPTCTLSQNGYGDRIVSFVHCAPKFNRFFLSAFALMLPPLSKPSGLQCSPEVSRNHNPLSALLRNA